VLRTRDVAPEASGRPLKIVFAGWVDALRRHDLEAVERHLHPDAVWQGLRPDLVCGDRAAVLDNLRQDQGWLPDVASIELHADGDQVLFGVRSPDLVEVAGEQLDEQIYEVFTIADGLRTPPAPVDDLIPFVHVADVARSIQFYELLGFAVNDTHSVGEQLDWASLSHHDAEIMLAGAGEPIDADDQAVLFYLFTADLPGLQQHLRAHGHRAGPIRDGSPGPAAEMRVRDPDGYVLMIAQRDA
jgi:hypothetical protein